MRAAIATHACTSFEVLVEGLVERHVDALEPVAELLLVDDERRRGVHEGEAKEAVHAVLSQSLKRGRAGWGEGAWLRYTVRVRFATDSFATDSCATD